MDESQLRRRRGFSQLPAWSRFSTGTGDRNAIAQNERNGDPSVWDVKSSPALGQLNQGFIRDAEELRERQQALDCLTRDSQGLCRDVNLGGFHAGVNSIGHLFLHEEFVQLTRQRLAKNQQRTVSRDALRVPDDDLVYLGRTDLRCAILAVAQSQDSIC